MAEAVESLSSIKDLNVTAAARQLGIAPSTMLRWLNDGFVAEMAQC